MKNWVNVLTSKKILEMSAELRGGNCQERDLKSWRTGTKINFC